MATHNRPALAAALAAYGQELTRLSELVDERSWEELEAALTQAQALRPEFL
jgi:prephenate dehydrogenase